MTQNQLKYWELRWKQHYEAILAEVKVREQQETVRHNKAVEEETRRHNKRQERIDTQEMITNRMNAQTRWEELKEKQRAALVAEALNEKKYELAIVQELREQRYTKAQIDKMLSDVKVSQMDLALSFIKAKHDTAANYIQAEAAAFKNGWIKGSITEVVGDVKGVLSSTEYDKFAQHMLKDETFTWMKEIFGPTAAEETFRILERNSSNSTTNTQGEWQGPLTKEQKELQARKQRFEARPDFQPVSKDGEVSGFSGTQDDKRKDNNNANIGVTVSTGSIGSTKKAVYIPASNNNSGVIYSPGSHYGPGW